VGGHFRVFRRATLSSFRRSAGILRWHLRRTLKGTDARLIENYFEQQGAKKLHIGCGDNILTGWLNSDLYPAAHGVLHLDATRGFPFEDGVFHYVFSEHMIEHITFSQGASMLAECFRVLGPGGLVRIATPDLAFLLGLCSAEKSEAQTRYVRWAIESFVPEATANDEVFVLNNFVRNWGHQFIYSESVLCRALESAGFVNIVRRELNTSDAEDLQNLENENRLPAGFLKLETMTIEAMKPLEAANDEADPPPRRGTT
jgi:predicted SAM-dependent methyltransferase